MPIACTDQLVQPVPASRALLTGPVERGEPLGQTVRALAELLERYGVAELTVAIDEALARGGGGHPNAVRLALERRRQAQAEPPPTTPESQAIRLSKTGRIRWCIKLKTNLTK